MSITLARKYRVLSLVKEAAPGERAAPSRVQPPWPPGNPENAWRPPAPSTGKAPNATPAPVRAAPPQAPPQAPKRDTGAGPGNLPQTNAPGRDISDYAKTQPVRPAAPTRASATPPAAPAESAFARSNREYAGIADKRLAAPAPSGKASVAPSGSSASQPSSSVKMEKGKGYAYLASKWGGGVTAAQVREHMGRRMLHAGKDYARPDAATLASIGKLTGKPSKFTLGAKKTAPAAPAAARAPQPQANTLSAPKPQFSTDGMNRMPGAEVRSPNAWRTPWTPK
jgi:hypothetical protein